MYDDVSEKLLSKLPPGCVLGPKVPHEAHQMCSCITLRLRIQFVYFDDLGFMQIGRCRG